MKLTIQYLRRLFRIITFSLLIFSPCISSAQTIDLDTLSVNKHTAQPNINGYLRVFHGPTTMGADEAWQMIRAGELTETPKKTNPGMSFPEHGYWAILTVGNTNDVRQTFYLEIDYPQLDYLELYVLKNNRPTRIYETGDRFPFSNRPVVARNFALPLTLAAEQSETLLIHMEKTQSTIRFPMAIYAEEKYNSHHFTDNLTYSLYFGIICLIAMGSLILGIILRQGVFIVYSFYLLGFGFWFFTRLGYPYQLFIPNMPEFNRHLLPAAVQIGIIGLIVYAMFLFKTKQLIPIYHKVMIGVLTIFIGGFIPWAIFPEEHIQYATYLFAVKYVLLTVTIIFIFTAAYTYRKRDRFRSNMFLLAYSLFLLSLVGKVIAEYGLINESLFLVDPILLGFFVEMIVLTITMSVLLKRLFHDNVSLQSENAHLNQTIESRASDFITLNSKAVLHVADIAYVKSDDHYVEYYLRNGKKEIDRNKLSKLKEILPATFIQTHRSFLVNMEMVRIAYSDKVIMQNGEEIKLSRTYKQEVRSKLDSL